MVKKGWKPGMTLDKSWEPLAARMNVGDTMIVIQRAGDYQDGVFLKAVWWDVQSPISSRQGTAKDWKSAVKAAMWWAADLDEKLPRPKGRAPKCTVDSRLG